MSQGRKRLFLVLFAFAMLALSSLACEEMDEVASGFSSADPTPMGEEWVPPSQRNLTAEQEQELLEMVEFSVDGSLPENTEAGLFLGEVRIWELRADGSTSLPLGGDERVGIALKIRNAGSADEWATLKTLGYVEYGAVICISFDGAIARIGIGNTGE